MEEMITAQMVMMSAALGQTNLVLAQAIKDLEGTPTFRSEEERTE